MQSFGQDYHHIDDIDEDVGVIDVIEFA